MSTDASTAKIAVAFDFDGTLGDTETPAMEVAYWELAPYLPGKAAETLEGDKKAFIQQNAGRAFEQMIENADQDRAKAGLPPALEAHASGSPIPPDALAVIDAARSRFGLPPFLEARPQYSSLLIQQKDETVDALGKCAQPNPGVLEMLEGLTNMGIPFCIATTSGKPRVPVCVDTAGLRRFFPDSHIHSGESDFDPPHFKPDPAVYLLAAEKLGFDVAHCVAVEDSASGIGSAANAKMGLIVGYVGASHIPEERKESHAHMLMQGTRSRDGRGAEIVITDIRDLLVVVQCFQEHVKQQTPKPEFTGNFQGPVYRPNH